MFPFPYAPPTKARAPSGAPLGQPAVPSFIARCVMRLPMVEVLLLVGCAAFNLMIGPVAVSLRPTPLALVPIAFGVLAGELAGLSIWLVWREIGFSRRLLVYWPLLCILLACFFIGLAATGKVRAVVTAVAGQPRLITLGMVARDAFCGLALVALTVQLPLWAMRIYAGWRIGRPTERGLDQPRPLSIADILGGTAVVAISVAALRFVGGDPSNLGASFRIGWVIAMPSIAAVSLISLLPALVCLLRHQVLWLGMLSLVSYATAAVVIPLVAILVLNPSVPLRADVVFLILLAVYSFAGTLAVPLLVVRARGYRLFFPGDKRG